MADISIIARRLKNGNVEYGWSGNGGYYSSVGIRLLAWYDNPADVDYLFGLGQTRLIGKKGSMINMIKDKTNCKIIVGQNGLVWVKGEEDMEQLTKDIIHMIEAEAHTSGLTNKVKNKLSLAIDGELPQEDDYSDDYEELEKPKLQNFKE